MIEKFMFGLFFHFDRMMDRAVDFVGYYHPRFKKPTILGLRQELMSKEENELLEIKKRALRSGAINQEEYDWLTKPK